MRLALVVFLPAIGDTRIIKVMQKRRLLYYFQLALVTVLVVSGGLSQSVVAVTSSSNNYQVTDTEFGATSNAQNCSGQYCARASIGSLSAGDSGSPQYQAKFGAITNSDPLLEVIVDKGDSDLGILSTEKTSTKTMVVRVRSYLSSGYTLQITGAAPKIESHSLKTNGTPTSSKPGTEQFAINAAANTTPNVGAGPVQVPSNQTSFGVVDGNYSVPNIFKYVSGDVIARSNSSSGQTDYTVSMIVNISNSTPSGHYAGDFAAIVVPVY